MLSILTGCECSVTENCKSSSREQIMRSILMTWRSTPSTAMDTLKPTKPSSIFGRWCEVSPSRRNENSSSLSQVAQDLLYWVSRYELSWYLSFCFWSIMKGYVVDFGLFWSILVNIRRFCEFWPILVAIGKYSSILLIWLILVIFG